MKNLVLVITLLLFFPSHINGQWYQQNSGTSSTILSVQFVNHNIGWTVVTESQGVYILFKTTNGGSDWFEQDTLISSLEGFFTTFYFLNESSGWFISYKFDETSNIYKTTDGGDNWNIQFITPPFQVVLGDIQFTDSLIGYTAGLGQLSSGYVYKSTDGGNNWELSLDPASAILTTSLAFINSDTGWVAGSNILKTTDGGNIWQEQFSIDPYYFSSVQFVNDEIGWASIDFPSGIFKTTDGGNTWFQQSAIELRSTFFVDTLYGWLVHDSNIYKTNNGGDDWILQNSGTDQELWDLFFIDQNAGWAVGNNGTILHTINGGLPVELVSFSAIVEVTNVTLSWITATELNNSGFEIQKKKSLEKNDWEEIGFIEGNGTTIKTKYYSFIDEDVSNGKYQYRLKQIDYDGSFEYSEIIEVEVRLPFDFSLAQNYPNPFNPSTKIKFTIPYVETGHAPSVLLKVYDVLGNEVVTLVNEDKPAGEYEVEFDATALTSGIYFYRLKAGSFIETKKMILIK